MPIGDDDCKACKTLAEYEMRPCKHCSCKHHYNDAELDDHTCGICGRAVFEVVHLHAEQTPEQTPLPGTNRRLARKWSNSVNAETVRALAAKDLEALKELGSANSKNGSTSERRRSVRFALPDQELEPTTPTPAGSHGNTEDTGSMDRPPYRPPHMRGYMLSPEVRPESSMSNRTFASQAPIQPTYRNHNGDANGGYTPRTNSTYGPGQLTQDMAAYSPFDPFIERPQRSFPSHAGVTPNGHNPMTPTQNTPIGHHRHKEVMPPPPALQAKRLSNADSRMQAPVGSPFNHNGTISNNNSNGQVTSSNFSTKPSPSSSNGKASILKYNGKYAPLEEDSTVSYASSEDDPDRYAKRAAHKAALIRAGAAEWKTDAEIRKEYMFGREPGPADSLTPNMPHRRGKVLTANTSLHQYGPSSMTVNTVGNAAAFLTTRNEPLPAWFSELAHGYKPTVQEVLDCFPMIDACSFAVPSTAGIVVIKNIPYTVTRAEIIAFLGRNVKILSMPNGSPFHAAHIMIERQSGKTMDAWVELNSPAEAAYVVKQFNERTNAGRPAKLQNRPVDVQLSSMGDFMAELFPSAKNVAWEGAIPQISNEIVFYYENTPSAGFQGFITPEEFTHMVKHAETPHRSPFANRCWIRVYEHQITLLHKYPWFATRHIFLHERHAMYDTTVKLIKELIKFLRKPESKKLDTTKPTATVLQELVLAALTCPGFSEAQKYHIVLILQQGHHGTLTTSRYCTFGGNHKYSTVWPFHALVKKPGVADELIDFIGHLFSEATTTGATFTISNIKSMLGVPDYSQVQTLADCVQVEARAVEKALSRMLPDAHSDGTSHTSQRS